MNCLEFRRIVGSDPNAQTVELLAHVRECAACSRYRDELQRMDRLIHRALEIEVGARPVHANIPRQWQPRWTIAASVIAACALGALLWLSAPRETFAAQLVTHIHGEPQSLLVTSNPVDTKQLIDVLTRSGVRLKSGVNIISYAMSCSFRGHDVPHLVVQTDQGPFTVLLLTQERRGSKREVFDEGGFHGVILPAPRGSIAVLGRDTTAEQIAERFLQAVEYLP